MSLAVCPVHDLVAPAYLREVVTKTDALAKAAVFDLCLLYLLNREL